VRKSSARAVRLTAAIFGTAVVVSSAAPAATGTAPSAVWRSRISVGHDTYVQSYYLANSDTTAILNEFNLTAALDGRSHGRTDHQWSLRAEVSGGSEVYREQVDAGYRWRPDAGDPRLRADVAWFGRQYRRSSDYSLTSDNQEGRAGLRIYPWLGRRAALDLRVAGRRVDFRVPSTLEQDFHEASAAGFLASRGDVAGVWRIGLRAARRAYPDSTAIDRDTYAAEGELERGGEAGELWIFHRSERRLIADETVRPSAWSHWTEISVAAPAGEGHLVADVTSEVWRYDAPTAVWFDSWRADAEVGYRWGDLLGDLWHALVTVENLEAGDSPEAYTQVGLRGSLASYGHAVTGVVALEAGRRWYRGADSADSTSEFDVLVDYSDFDYVELWIMANWAFAARMSLELTASYQPERHTEQDDDAALGYASARLVWRP